MAKLFTTTRKRRSSNRYLFCYCFRRWCCRLALLFMTLSSFLLIDPTTTTPSKVLVAAAGQQQKSKGSSSSSTSNTDNSGGTSKTKFQQLIDNAWNHLVDDFDTSFKSIFADDAKIKMCLKGMPFCTEGTFNEMLEGFRVAFTQFHVKHKFLTGFSHEDTILVEWVNSIETKEGCKAMWWGYSTYEFNADGKIKRFLGMSEESDDVIRCVQKVSGIKAEL